MASVGVWHQVVEGGQHGSALAKPDKLKREISCDSDCSTASGNQDSEARLDEDSLSDRLSCSESDGVETLLLFDWDDTLFPTSWCEENGLFVADAPLTREQEAQLQMMAERSRSTLQTALQFGTVVIVTNAEQGWVEKSCTYLMPSLVSLLNTIRIVSARSTYEQYAHTPSEWKSMAFTDEVSIFNERRSADEQHNVVSVGDSVHELRALMAVTKGMTNCCGKSIKFLEVPTIEQLIDQHELLGDCLVDVLEHNGDLDVEVGSES